MCTPARSSAARRSLSLTRARAPHSPYDLLGLFENATDADVKDAYRDLARLFHPDRNHGKDQSAERTEHFVRIKKAYECLIDPEKRRMYDVCAVNRERLVRRNIWKFAVNHIPDYRDTVDIQVRERARRFNAVARDGGVARASLRPQFRDHCDDLTEIAEDALVLCCESCGAPSQFRCSICDMLTCGFCSLKMHAKDGIPPHYPARRARPRAPRVESSAARAVILPRILRYTPHYRQKMASEGREHRLLKNQEELASKWHKADDIKETERRVFKNLIKKVRARTAMMRSRGRLTASTAGQSRRAPGSFVGACAPRDVLRVGAIPRRCARGHLVSGARPNPSERATMMTTLRVRLKCRVM